MSISTDAPPSAFDVHFDKLVTEYLTSSACFLIKFEDRTEGLICLPQNALVRDLYNDLELRLEDIYTPKCLYADQKRSSFIPKCSEALSTMIEHYGIRPLTTSSAIPTFRLYLSTKPQSTKNYASVATTTRNAASNLSINGRAIPPSFSFGTGMS